MKQLPYTAKVYANGTIFDSIGDSNLNYYQASYDGDNVFYLYKNTGLVDYINTLSEVQSSVYALTPQVGDTVRSFVTFNEQVIGFEGYNAKKFNDYSAVYILNENKLMYETFDHDTKLILLSSKTHIRDYHVNDTNLWVLHDQSKLTKFNKHRVQQFSVDVQGKIPLNSVFLTNISLLSIDFIREYTKTGYKQYPIILGYTQDKQLFLVKFNEQNNTFYDTKMLPAYGEFFPHSSDKHRNYNLTNSEFLNEKYKTQPTLMFKLRLKNIYNVHDQVEINIPVDIDCATGDHHFVFRLDTLNGKVDLFIDGRLYSSKEMPAVNYTFQDIFYENMTVGTTYFYNNYPLYKKLNQHNYYFTDNCRMRQFKLYNKVLTDNEIRLHTYNGIDIPDVVTSIPCGQRSEIEQIDRFFNLNVPGAKSNNVNVIIKDSNITNTQLQEQLKQVILKKLKKVLPATTNVNDIVFKDYSFTVNQQLSS